MKWVDGDQGFNPYAQFQQDMQLRDAVTQGAPASHVRQLIDNGAQVNSQKGSNNALAAMIPPLLHVAAREGRPHLIEVLVGADHKNKDIRDINGRTALHVAALEGRADCVHTLMQLNLNAETVDNNGFSAIDLAYARGHTGIIENMRSNGYKCEPPADMDKLRADVAAVYPPTTRSHVQQQRQRRDDGPQIPIR